jgi:hypothetical protein
MDVYEAMFSNVYNGWKCFLGMEAVQLDTDLYVDCSESMWVVVGYVLSNAVVMLCMSSVLMLSNQILGRATEAAIFAAFAMLWVYDVHINDSSMFGGNAGIIDIVAIVVLIVGMEVYDRDPEPDVQVITNRVSKPAAGSSSSNSEANSPAV